MAKRKYFSDMKGHYPQMKQSIRKGVFETNSSSVHAIVVDRDSIESPENPVLVFHSGESYLRTFREAKTQQERANYLWVTILSYYYNGDKKEISNWANYIYDVLADICVAEFEEEKPYPDKGVNDIVFTCYAEISEFLRKIRKSPKYLIQYLFGTSSKAVAWGDESIVEDLMPDGTYSYINNFDVPKGDKYDYWEFC